jgi:methanogenic corrinoid protein MtbC1
MNSKFENLSAAIKMGDVEQGVEESLQLVENDTNPADIFGECIGPTLNEMGEQFAKLEIFLPELMLASRVVTGIQEKLVPMLKGDESNSIVKGRAVIATAFGDLHDIGKNMVSLMMQVNGFDVRDLGVNVSTADIIKAANEHDADLILLSGLMVPSMPYIVDTIGQVKENPKFADRFKILVGGGPVTKEWALESGADGYADDAIGAVNEALRIMQVN